MGMWQVSLIRCYLVHAVKAGRMDEVEAFFRDYGDHLMAGPEAPDWAAWFALPYVKAPAAHPSFAACFGAEWAALVEAAFRNFLAEVVQQLPLPAILHFNADREQRAQLQRRAARLAEDNARLRQVGGGTPLLNRHNILRGWPWRTPGLGRWMGGHLSYAGAYPARLAEEHAGLRQVGGWGTSPKEACCPAWLADENARLRQVGRGTSS